MFFNFAKSQGSFQISKLYDKKVIDIDGISVQINLLNSAPFSTLEPDDKEFHYLPSYVYDNTVRNEKVELKITVMHHSYEWCEYNTSEMVRKIIADDNITFFGHEHKAESVKASFSGGETYNIVKGGAFYLDTKDDAAFDVVIYDDNKKLSYYEFNWSVKDGLFLPSDPILIEKRATKLKPSDEYLNSLFEDKQGISDSVLDYFAFPKLTAEGSSFSDKSFEKTIMLDDVFSALKLEKQLHIIGKPKVGKTTLLNYLYKEASDREYLPLMIAKLPGGSDLNKIIKRLFEDQYGTAGSLYTMFCQAEPDRVIVFLDDIDKIVSEKAQRKILDYIFEKGWNVVYSSQDINNIEETAKDYIQGKETNTIRVLETYRTSRNEIIDRAMKYKNKSDDEIAAVKSALDYLAQCQTSFLTFTPVGVLQYVKFIIDGNKLSNTGRESVALVYDTNINSAMLNAENNQETAVLYLSVLNYIAGKMYFERKTEIDLIEVNKYISEFNSERMADVKEKRFIDACLRADILLVNSDEFKYSFSDNNKYAYFVAKSIQLELDEESGMEHLKYVMNNICFGINDEIVLFLSYFMGNSRLILNLAEDALNLLKDNPQWDIKSRNITFLHNSAKVKIQLPGQKEKKENEKRLENEEKKRHEELAYKSVFDYDDSDAQKPRYVTMRAFKYAKIVGRALADQYGNLKTDKVNKMLEVIFVVPQKVIYDLLHFTDVHQDEIIDRLYLSLSSSSENGKKISREVIQEALSAAGIVFALNVMDDVAFNSTNTRTISALRNRSLENNNDKILELMMEENTGNSREFCDRAIALRKDLKDDPFSTSLISRIAHKHFMYNENIDHTIMDKLITGKVFTVSGKPKILLTQGKRENN